MFSALYGFFKPLVHPAGLIWLLCVVAAIVLLLRKRRLAALCLGLVALLMSLLGGRAAVYLVGWLEQPYVRATLDDVPQADAIVLLGGGYELTKNDVLGLNLNEGGDRVLMAIELSRLKKAPALVIGGGRAKIDGREITESEALAKLLTNWGMTNATLRPLDWSRNTREEALKTAALAQENGWKKILLVTSGYHMRRAEAVFSTTGLEVVPVACDFQRTGTPYESWFRPFPIRNGFQLMEIYLHEKFGWWIYRWRGWINKEAAAAAP
ncbi:MAG: YdcF family protein [Verrucomicrobia bacterium]|nr:YdcF family protein [Verrucomicrobiota bacterium]